MRLLIVLMIVFLAVISLGFWTNHQLAASTADLMRQIDGLAEDIKKGDWEGATNKMARLERTWEKKAGWWPMVLDHQEMDNIEFAMARFRGYIASQNSSLSRGQLSELKVMIKHIPEREAVSFKNIF